MLRKRRIVYIYIFDGKKYTYGKTVNDELYLEHILCTTCKLEYEFKRSAKVGSLKNLMIDYIQENDIDDSNMPKLLMCPNSKEKQIRKAQQFISKSKQEKTKISVK